MVCICFYCSAFCDTSSRNITSVYVFNPLNESNTQIQEHHKLSGICYCIAYSKQINEFEPVLALTVIVLIFFTMKYLLLEHNNQASYQTETFGFTIHTPVTSTSYTQSCQYLTHKTISNLTVPHLKADHLMLKVIVSNKLIQPGELIDLKKSQQIFVSSKALGGELLRKVEGPCSITSCGPSEKSSKYYVIKNSTSKIQDMILTNNPNLSEDSILCQKCYLRLKRGQNLIVTSKPKKCQKLDRPKCIINSCKRESKYNSGATKEDIVEWFGPSINNENQDLVRDSLPFCSEHYMELYHFLNKCSLCKSRLESKSNRYCSEPDLLNMMNVTSLFQN